MTDKDKIYLSPEIQVIELENESILCQSSGSTEDLENGSPIFGY